MRSSTKGAFAQPPSSPRHTAHAARDRDSARAVARPCVSGRYRSVGAGFEVELRVDIDGRRATNRVSADYFRGDADRTYVGSMRVDKPVVALTPGRVTITGDGVFTKPTKHTRVTITIPYRAGDAPYPATLSHFTRGGTAGARYDCAFECESFRTVALVESVERSVMRLASYDTGAMPSAGPARALSAVTAFAEAGIETVQTREAAEVVTSRAGTNTAWSDAELHAAMELSFGRPLDRPQWAVWLLHAVMHEDPSVFGLMFDRQGLQRQGCAIFYHGLTPTTPQDQRELLRVCVHEIGHAFNLPHSWQPTNGASAMPSRPSACSWMNYPERFPGGTATFWKDFAFQFDDAEIAHLRHAFRDNIIPGGDPFVGSAASTGPEARQAAACDTGLRLRISAPASLALGVPVTVGLELAATTLSPVVVPRVLGPRPSTVDIAIKGPGGSEVVFAPLLRHCRGQEQTSITVRDTPIRDYAFIHYGRDRFSFEAPGTYRVRARHITTEGAVVLSNEVVVRVREPATRLERDVARLVAGDDEVGTLMSLMGSDAPALRRGNETLQTIIERFPGHPLADVARVVRGANLARGFKLLTPDGAVSSRAPDSGDAAALVDPVVDVARLHALAPDQAAVTTDITTRRGVDPLVHAFVNSRRSEINATVQVRQGDAVARTAPDAQLPPSRSNLSPTQQSPYTKPR